MIELHISSFAVDEFLLKNQVFILSHRLLNDVISGAEQVPLTLFGLLYEMSLTALV